MLLILLLALISSVVSCPSPGLIRTTIFQKVVEQEPFPGIFAGITVYNGVSLQNEGICDITGDNCTVMSNTCPSNQTCLALSKELIFNLIPTNPERELSSQDVTDAVHSAQTIKLTGSFQPSPYIPNLLCMYDISDFAKNYTCLPKFCLNSEIPCINSSKTCECIAEPCQLYYAINISSSG